MKTRLDDLMLIVAIADYGGFSPAARALGLPKSTLSRRLSDYEARLGKPLFHRSTRAVSLTSDGSYFYERAKPVIDAVKDVADSLEQEDAGPTGHVTMTTTAAMGQLVIAPLLADLVRQFPSLKLEMRLSEDVENIISEGIDLAIRLGELSDSSLIARRLMKVDRTIVASPAFIEEFGQPQSIKQLQEMKAIVTNPMTALWRFEHGEAINPNWKISAGNMLVARDLCRNGHGISALPNFMIQSDIENGSLVTIMPEQKNGGRGCFDYHRAPTAQKPARPGGHGLYRFKM